MKQLIKLAALVFAVITISACGKMGELESVKAEKVALTTTTNTILAINQASNSNAVAPGREILPHNSK